MNNEVMLKILELNVILLTLALLHALVKCSQVIDKTSEQGLYAPDYCKSLGVCSEGTHVMCTHFYPNRTMGPLCAGTRNVTITPEYAELILDLFNLIRGRSAKGRTIGLANLPLPRAYGMFRLQWDPELSTLAQVWANTCIISVDMCRAAKRFPDPAQLAGLTRFDANWIPINARGLFNYTGFSLEKVKYGIHSMLRSWYRTKESVHPDDITEADDIWPKHLGSNAFLAVVHGRVTHVGCGISIFKEYSFHASLEHRVDLIHNVVRVVCNLSSRLLVTPRKDRVYTTDSPTKVGYTVKCGCPIGYDEDEDCLCYESGRKLPVSCKNRECKPSVVVLPIFTVENAPPSKLNVVLRKDESNHTSTNEIDLDHLDSTRSRRHNLRESIFLKPSIFELPPRKPMTERTFNKLLKDVSPRKDFSNVRQLVSKYLNIRRRTNITKSKPKVEVKDFSTTSPSKFRNIRTVNHNNKRNENFIDPTRRKIVYDNFTLPNTNSNLKVSKLDPNNKLISLLNKLEEEAKYFPLTCDRKKILDHKIRKIYSVFVEKAFMPRNNRIINEVADKNISFSGFLENDRLSKHEQQFSTLREKKFFEVPNSNLTSNNQIYKNTNTNSMKVNQMDDNPKGNSFAYNINDNLLEIRNIHGIGSNQNSKGVKTIDDLKNENSRTRGKEDLLSFEKRQFYEEKLNYLKRKLQDFHNHGNINNMHVNQHIRRTLPNYHELQLKRKRPYFNRFLDF